MSASPSPYIPRHVIVTADGPHSSPQPVDELRDHAAYVLLGEPGSGKTRLFAEEAAALGDAAHLTTVRELLRSRGAGVERGRVLYIDAMDELRAPNGSVETPLDSLIGVLATLGRPRFRLSCRAADWHPLDSQHLASVSADKTVAELHLQPFSERDIVYFLRHGATHQPSNPDAFVARAREYGLQSMLGNPMLLDLLARAVAGDAWPASRGEIFERACRHLAQEHKEAYQRRPGPADTEQLLDDAGLLCAVLLLSDELTYRLTGQDDTSVRVAEVPGHLNIDIERVQRALHTQIFVGNARARHYRHRAIAEFLAARAIAKRLHKGLPVSRVLAHMSGAAGGIVDALRGLFGWLASLPPGCRDVLMHRDILALVYYGDVYRFSPDEKRRVFETIHATADTSAAWVRRDWQSTAFGALGTRDMQPYLAAVLARDRFEDADEVLMVSVLEAIEHGEPMPALLDAVEAVVRDARHPAHVRHPAADALMAQAEPDNARLVALLAAIGQGTVEDDDELAGRLLQRLYPSVLDTRTLVRDYLRPPRKDNFFGSYREFWELELWDLVPTSDAAVLADAVGAAAQVMGDHPGDTFADGIYGKAVLHAVGRLGSSLRAEQLYRWIAMGLNKYGYRLRSDVGTQALGQWLLEHPEQLRAVYLHGLLEFDAQGRPQRFDGWARTLLGGAELPAGWDRWLLEVAGSHDNEAIVRHCFSTAAWAAALVPERFPDGVEQVAAWMAQHHGRWPACDAWREDSTTVALEDWRREAQEEQRDRARQIAALQAYRREQLGQPRSGGRYRVIRGCTHPARLQPGPRRPAGVVPGARARAAWRRQRCHAGILGRCSGARGCSPERGALAG